MRLFGLLSGSWRLLLPQPYPRLDGYVRCMRVSSILTQCRFFLRRRHVTSYSYGELVWSRGGVDSPDCVFFSIL